MLNLIQRCNSKINHYLAPDSPDRIELYKNILTGIDFDRALHLGAGSDKRGIGTELEERGEVIVLDPDETGLEENTSERKVLADGQRLPFKMRSFDLVFSEFVFEHIPEPRAALEEIDRILRPGGSFVVLVPNPDHYYARIADLTPFWFHKLWFRLQGVENVDRDKFPTTYNWGTYSDISDPEFDWEIEEFHSFPGPTAYTKILPIHPLFLLYDRLMVDRPEHHVAYLVHYEK